jgi:signal peptidase I
MEVIFWPFKFAYEMLVDLVLSIIGHHRNKASFERRQGVYKPIRDLIHSLFKINVKTRTYEQQLSKGSQSLSYKITSFVLLVLAILLLRYSVIEPYKIPSGSMIPTLKIGDHIFVNKLAYGLRIPFIGEVKRWSEPKRGDVVIFAPPETPQSKGKVYVKRLIGLPGDRIRIEDDELYVNGQFIKKVETSFYPAMTEVADDEQYVPENFTLYTEDLVGIKHYALQLKDRSRLGYPHPFSVEILVPEGSLFFMGDNRDNSEDSRFWGFASRREVRGKAMFIWLSLNWKKMFTPSWIRFERFGKSVK